jgi:hypothetical protein
MTRPPRGPRPRSSTQPAPHAGMPASSPASRRYVVDRVEGKIAVLEDADADGNTIDVDATRFPSGCAEEGALLEVPLSPDGTPQWEQATRDRVAEQHRRSDAARRLERLQRNDDGGDIAL